MAQQLIETLLVSANGNDLVGSLDKKTYHIKMVKDPGKAMEALRDTVFDLILLDDTIFSNDLISVIKEMKRRAPLLPVIVLSENIDAAY